MLYEFRIKVKNLDIMAQRLTIQQPKSPHVRVGTKKFGLVAPGISREILVRIQAKPDIIGKFKSDFNIITKHNIYTVLSYTISFLIILIV